MLRKYIAHTFSVVNLYLQRLGKLKVFIRSPRAYIRILFIITIFIETVHFHFHINEMRAAWNNNIEG